MGAEGLRAVGPAAHAPEEQQIIEVHDNQVPDPQVQEQASESETHKTCEKPAAACWYLVIILVLVPIWISLVLADMGLYAACRIVYMIAHFMGACCVASAMSTNSYTPDGDRHSKKDKSDQECMDQFLSFLSCILGVALYIVAAVTFGIAKMAIKILPYILPIESVCEWIEEHDEQFVWMDPRIEPTHTETRISTRYV